MSDFVSMQSIKMKNKIMNPQVLCALREGNLTMQDLQNTNSPLQEIYKNTYSYSQYPSVSESASKMIDAFLNSDEYRKKKE